MHPGGRGHLHQGAVPGVLRADHHRVGVGQEGGVVGIKGGVEFGGEILAALGVVLVGNADHFHAGDGPQVAHIAVRVEMGHIHDADTQIAHDFHLRGDGHGLARFGGFHDGQGELHRGHPLAAGDRDRLVVDHGVVKGFDFGGVRAFAQGAARHGDVGTVAGRGGADAG